MLHERLLGYAEEASIEGGYPAISMAIEEELCSGSSRYIEIKIFTAIAEEIERDYIPKSDHEKALNAMVEAQIGVNEPGYRSAHYVMQEYAKSKGMPLEDGDCITDWLNRWFVPRPRYEDGAPVQFGDEVELHYRGGGCDKGRMQSFHPNSGPVWILSFVGCNHERLYRYDSESDVLKRPAPKVLDTDGVPYEIGQKVWHIETGEEFVVSGLPNPSEYQSVRVRRASGGCETRYDPTRLTHREPDSLEKLRDDLMDAHESWDSDPNKLVDYADRLTALIERGA